MPRINKVDLIAQVADKHGKTKVEATASVNAVLETITANLKAGNDVAIVGFGTFAVKTSTARIGRNPATGASVNIPAKTSAKFKAAKDLI